MKRRGLTLVEMLVSLALSFTLLVAMLSTLQVGQRYFLGALDALALSDCQYRVPREIVQKLMASSATQVTPGNSNFSFITAYNQQNQFQVTPEGLPDWQGQTLYRLNQGRLTCKEPWEKSPRTLTRNLVGMALKPSNGSFLLTLNIEYDGYTRDYRGEVSMWATPVN